MNTFANSKSFLKVALKSLVFKIPQLKIIYGYNDFDSSHIIKVEPLSIYDHDSTYIQFEKQLVQSFIKNFPYEDIIFISEKDTHVFEDIDEIIEIFEGAYFLPELQHVNIKDTFIVKEKILLRPTTRNVKYDIIPTLSYERCGNYQYPTTYFANDFISESNNIIEQSYTYSNAT